MSREQKVVEDFIMGLLSGLDNDGFLPVIEIPRGEDIRMEDELELLCENDHDHRADSMEEEDIEVDADSKDAGEDISEMRAEMMCTEAAASSSSSACTHINATNGRIYDFYNPNTCQAYTQLLCVAATVAELLASGNTMKLRDVYYSNKSSFSSQQQCNSTILDLGRYLGLRRYEMGVVPASKGLVMGHMKFAFKKPRLTPAPIPGVNLASVTSTSTSTSSTNSSHNAEVNEDETSGGYGNLQCCLSSAQAGGMLISPQWTSTTAENIDVQVSLDIKYLLVVEKEGIFQRLGEDRFYYRVPCIIVTGCGFPDVATRALVSKVCLNAPHLQVVGVADYNPYGAALLLSYKVSSAKSKTMLETSVEGTCPSLRWLGLRTQHIHDLGRDIGEDPFSAALQRYTTHDHSKMSALLRNPHILQDQCCRGWHKELLAMRKVDRKCELEAIYLLHMSAVSEWIERCLLSTDFI